MPFEYKENENRIFDYCVYRTGDTRPMQCFETAEEAQAYWMGLTVSEKLQAEQQKSKEMAEALLLMLKKN